MNKDLYIHLTILISACSRHLLGLMVQGLDNTGRCTNNLAGCHPIETN